MDELHREEVPYRIATAPRKSWRDHIASGSQRYGWVPVFLSLCPGQVVWPVASALDLIAALSMRAALRTSKRAARKSIRTGLPGPRRSRADRVLRSRPVRRFVEEICAVHDRTRAARAGT